MRGGFPEAEDSGIAGIGGGRKVGWVLLKDSEGDVKEASVDSGQSVLTGF